MTIEDTVNQINNAKLADVKQVYEAIWLLADCVYELDKRLKQLEKPLDKKDSVIQSP